MRLIPSDPEIETLLSRIERGELDLQPDFQRGEVWSPKKRQLLVDSILRQWHVPPIHVVETDLGEEVLDGQQRLVSIREFHQGRLKVDGKAEPRSSEIEALHGLTFHELPEDLKRRFLRFAIRFFKIVDYSAEEPAELFYRLNQPVTLTSPEQRNAFFGAVRAEVRKIVSRHSGQALDKDFLSFSNSRMAWDDVVSRLCYVLEAGTLRSKVTAHRLASRYRRPEGFPDSVLAEVDAAMNVLGKAKAEVPSSVRFNKATLFTWLYFFSKASAFGDGSGAAAGSFITFVETGRQRVRHEGSLASGGRLGSETTSRLMSLLHDRASSRVGDVFSVLARDFVLWSMLYSFSSVLELGDVAARHAATLQTVASVCSKMESWSPPPPEAEEESEGGEKTSFEGFLENLLTEEGWEEPA